METILCIEGKKANKIEIFLKRARLVPVLVSGLFYFCFALYAWYRKKKSWFLQMSATNNLRI